ncbi:CHAT domain-containing protein [Streptomyces sp. F63]|uniref:CHAT domain-containing protein n=1 Tax=Streptomyces sp. F63 TaxID=2824887 RepID=UPI001B36BB19|nr:CHAT domain-containing protein [Streptomyces sp. F63]MBQ0983573.1 CHAT domain-containing protein [Streptomyces sp. F63]
MPQANGHHPQNPGSAIRALVEALDIEDLIMRFDVDFDAPMRQADATGMLRLARAHTKDPAAGPRGIARRVGAHWCDIVQADVDYELLSALQLIEASQQDAERLMAWHTGSSPDLADVFPAYALARWHDGVGRIRYRLGSYTASRRVFGIAVQVAERARLWWALPDLLSNYTRAEFEERSQAARERDGDTEADAFVPLMREMHDRVLEQANHCGVDTTAVPGKATPLRHREFLRGYSNALHNLATALRQAGDIEQSLRVTARSKAISEGLNDTYRVSQSLLNQAFCGDRPVERFETLRDMGRRGGKSVGPVWERGRRIARQNLARRSGGPEGLAELGRLLDELEDDAAGTGRRAGLDVDFYAYTVRFYRETAAALPASDRPDDVLDRRLRMAESVREAIALPVYKRAYANHVRPAYLRAIGVQVSRGGHRQEDLEKIVSLVEESSGRELLDLLASSRPPVLDRPAHPLPTRGETEEGSRRSRLPAMRVQPPDPAMMREMREMLVERAQQYEDHFLHHPLTSATHDEDIAHQLVQYTLNHQGSCVVRYFRFGTSDAALEGEETPVPDSLGIMVCRDGVLTLVPAIPYGDVAELARQVFENLGDPEYPVPREETCHRMWDVLVGPVWESVNRGGPPTHLTLIPTDDIFAMPLHVATERGDNRPLAARVPLSHSVSVAAFVTRGRHLLKKQLMEDDDDLAALLSTDDEATGGEIVDAGWRAGHVHVAGGVPDALVGGVGSAFGADWDGLERLVAMRPEFFVYAGHGLYVDEPEVSGPLIYLGRTDMLSQFDLALRVSLPRNKLTVLGACLAGQGMRSDGGDVLGFMRSLITSGAGAIGVPLWSVQDSAMVSTVGALLRGSRAALGSSSTGVFDVVQALHDHYREGMETFTSLEARVDRLPLALYL